MRPGFDDTSATDLRLIVVNIFSAAAGVTTVFSACHFPSATDAVITLINYIVTAALPVISVNLRPAATGIRSRLGAGHIVWTTNMRGGVVHQSATAATAVILYVMKASAADLLSPVVHDSIAASRVITVWPTTYAIVHRYQRIHSLLSL